MKLLTVNMCMHVGPLQERLEALGKLVQSKRPEFIALQGVSNEIMRKINGTMWGTRYNLSHPPTKYETRTKPTVAILSTYPPQQTHSLTYVNTVTNKVLLRGDFVMYDKQKQPHVISVCSTHLEEGGDKSEVREIQINEAFLSLKDDEDCFVLGDFSLVNDIDGDLHLDGGWHDSWVTNGKGSGETVVPTMNPLLKGEVPSGRPDRIFYKSLRYKLESVEVVGKEPISGTGIHVSPHFGVLASFTPLEQLNPPADLTEVPCFFNRKQWSLNFQQQK